MKARRFCMFVSLILVLLLSGCSLAAPEPTATPIPPTATPVPPTETPIPTATSTSTPLPTATATPDAKATKAAIATAEAEEATAKIEEILKDYDLSTSEGEFGEVMAEPLKISAVTYDAMIYDLLSKGSYTDFAFYTEITWTSTSGLAGCCITFRSEDTKLEQDFFRLRTQPLCMPLERQWPWLSPHTTWFVQHEFL